MKSFKQAVEHIQKTPTVDKDVFSIEKTVTEKVAIPEKIQDISESIKEEADLSWVDKAPDFYKQLWESLNEKLQLELLEQSTYYDFSKENEIEEFWVSRKNIPHPEIKPTESDIIEESKNDDSRKLFRDKQELFECELQIEGARKDETVVRMIVETEDWTLVFPGKFRNGKCEVPIKKLSILDEGSKGIMKLEVIVEDTVFTPWEENFIVKNSKNVKVKVNENTNTEKPQTVKVNVIR